jgi:multicomponent Na+:H+ antiporter subunit C
MNFIKPENIAIILFFIGLFGIILRKNIMITIIGISIMDAAIILFFINTNNAAIEKIPEVSDYLVKMVDPIPHALMITSVVIGVAVQAVILILILNYYNINKTLNSDEALKKYIEGQKA